jgi:predicted nucleic acid-binding protein
VAVGFRSYQHTNTSGSVRDSAQKAGSPPSIEEVRSIIQDYLSWEVVTNTHQSILQALDIEARYKISSWDAMVIQAAENAGCAILYSKDLKDQQRFGSVQVINPLKG